MQKVPFVDTRAQHRALEARLITAVQRLLADGSFVGSQAMEGFERQFSLYLGATHTVGVANGTDAIRLALLAMGIGPECRVVTVPNTYVGTVEAIVQTGASVDFVAVDPQTLLLDLDALESKLRKERGSTSLEPIRAVVPVHLFGSCVDMRRVQLLADEFNFRTCEDACQAHGAEIHGSKAGTLGDCAAFSFYPSKNLGALGDGGAVVTRDSDIAARVRCLRDHGQVARNVHQEIGWNSRLDALQAEFLQIKLEHLDAWNAIRARVSRTYDTLLSGSSAAERVEVPSYCRSAHHLYVLRCHARDAVIAVCEEHGVSTGIHYPTPIHLQPAFRLLGMGRGCFPVAESAASQILSLPLFPEIEEHQIQTVVRSVRHGLGLSASW